MELTLAVHPISNIRFVAPTRVENTTLFIDADELRGQLLTDKSLVAVDFEIVSPGESCRAAPVFYIIEPRAKTGTLYAKKVDVVHTGMSAVCCSHEQTPRLCRDNDP